MSLRLPLVLGLVFAAGLATAEPLAQSPLPKPRPVLAEPNSPAPILATVASRRPRARPGSTVVPVIEGAALPARARLRPHPRPTAAQLAPVTEVAILTHRLPIAASVVPPRRPDNLKYLITLAAVTMRTQPVPEVTTGRKGAVCGDPAIQGETIPPIAAKLKGCGLGKGVKITSVAGVRMSTPAVTDCTTAKSLKRWLEAGVIPSVGKLGGGVARLQVAASYSCRPRNNNSGAKISEHGRGRALDIAAIVLQNGTVVSVLKGWGTLQQGKLLKKIRKAACGPFNTVLGPGSDHYHRDHFHLDTARGRGPYCH